MLVFPHGSDHDIVELIWPMTVKGWSLNELERSKARWKVQAVVESVLIQLIERPEDGKTGPKPLLSTGGKES